MTPEPPLILAEPERPFWGFGEVFVIAALFMATALVVFSAGNSLLQAKAKLGYWSVTEEFIVYAVLFFALRLLFGYHGKPLFRSLGWIPQPFSASSLLLIGLFLSVFVIVLQVFVLRTPQIETPFEKLLGDPVSRVAIALFGITLGPIVEELLFRGFLQPVLTSGIGVFPGILLTSALFGAMHLSQNAGLWQSGVLIMLVGFVLGVIRHISGSTRASAITHAAYNSLPCIALLLQGLPQNHK